MIHIDNRFIKEMDIKELKPTDENCLIITTDYSEYTLGYISREKRDEALWSMVKSIDRVQGIISDNPDELQRLLMENKSLKEENERLKRFMTTYSPTGVDIKAKYQSIIENKKIESLNLDTATYNLLKRHNIDLIGDLVNHYTRETLPSIKGLSDIRINMIENALKKQHIGLKEKIEDE